MSMDDELFTVDKGKRRINPIFVAGAIVGLVIVGGAIWWLLRTPSYDDQTARILEGAYRAGSPEFAELAKNIQIARDDNNTVESPKGTGKISMYIRGNITNKTGKTITVLLVNVSIINQQNQSIRDKDVIVVPVQQASIPPGETVPITCTLDGFDRKDDRANINFKVTAVKVE
jgi:hypothetical protein